MNNQIIRQPFMLLETVNMLYKYVNGITFPSLLEVWKKAASDPKYAPMVRRFEKLQQIMDQVCADVDVHDPEMQRFFAHVECDGGDTTCLAMLMTASFLTLEKPGFRDQVEEICRNWRQLQERNYWLDPCSAGMLLFRNGSEHPGELIYQIQRLNYPAEFRLELCGVLTRFEAHMHRLAELLEPFAQRLERIYAQESWMLEEIWAFWEKLFPEFTPLDMVLKVTRETELGEDCAQTTWFAFSLMNTNSVVVVTTDSAGYDLDHNCLFVGGAITPDFYSNRTARNLDEFSTVLKYISDRKRLEILRLLSKNRSYGHSLAEATGIHPGNISRNLAMLHQYGFLKQEKEPWRTYYETDQEALHDFLVRLEREICS